MTGPAGRLTDAEALMWTLDEDRALHSAFVSVTFVDRPPDFDRLRARVADALTSIDSLTKCVAVDGLHWDLDDSFDLDFHLRHLSLPPPATRRDVLDYAALLAQDPFDRARPLWQFTVVEGLAGGEAALIAKMHHVVSDGIGAVRMSASFLDLSPDGDLLDRPASPPAGRSAARATPGNSIAATAGAAIGAARHATEDALGLLLKPQRLPALAGEGIDLARSLLRQVAVVEPARSPLWTGHRTHVPKFETLSVELDAVRTTAKALGGTVNDVFVTAVAGAAGDYHRARGIDVAELRMSMPVSTRNDRASGGNAWVPTRVLVPAGEPDPLTRFEATSRRLARTKREPSLRLGASLTGLVRFLPRPLLIRLARQQVGTVDFACSNVRGAPFDLWIAGARVLANHPMGPTAGTAFNATVLSYKDRFDVGLNMDAGAIDDPAELRTRIEESFNELVERAAQGRTAAAS
jgi:diacylglycerol O-acyltransferase / wax synthase